MEVNMSTISSLAKRSRSALLFLLLGLAWAGPSQAYIAKLFGWDLSKNETYQQVTEYVALATGVASFAPPPTPFITRIVKGALIVIDPPVESALISGRVSLQYDPSFQVLAAGWFGEFGADVSLPAPPVPVPAVVDIAAQLQLAPNPAMSSSDIRSTPGRTVFEFNWGPDGFVGTRNMDSEGHVNFAGLVLTSPSFETGVVGAPTNFVRIAGSREETAALGTESQTYLLCAGGYCGANPIPEPSTFALMTISLLVLLLGRKATGRRRPG
jgi:hypothetical protein